MAIFRGTHNAFGAPGIDPRWTAGDKEGVGTAYSASSRLWFTLARGIVTEVYYPTVDRPQIRDLQFLITDGATFFHEEKRHLQHQIERIGCSLGYKISSRSPDGRYSITKEILSDPHLPCLLLNTSIEGDAAALDPLKFYLLCAPHLNGGGRGNNAYVIEVGGRQMLAAERNNIWLVIWTTALFSRLSCGYVGSSDGWTDLAHGYQMDWEFDRALDGNVALTGQIDLSKSREFTVAMSFGDSLHSAITTLLQSIAMPFEDQRARFIEQWERPQRSLLPIEAASSDDGKLYRSSFNQLLAHEDKTYQGAMIASMAIPWGEGKGDDDGFGGYHLVWTRDMVQSATGLLAAGNKKTAIKAHFYLAASQQPDGGFAQNFWINGEPYWHGIQLDELAFPVILTYRLRKADLLGPFSINTASRAIAYLVLKGPVTQEERWEECAGYSPSTLAAIVASLICAASMARERGHTGPAEFLEEYADYLYGHLEDWLVTNSGTLLPEVPRHFVRINPVNHGQVAKRGALDDSETTLNISNMPPGERFNYPARDIVDPGFLELVRYGILRPDDPLIVDSLRVVDATLKVDTPFGPCWHRYNHDAYGQGHNAAPYITVGTGRAWPLLTGERGHYELAAGHDPLPFLHAMERFATETGMLPEQVWDEADLPAAHMCFGKPTGSAMPLMWAHAEYIKLLHSIHDGRVYDLIPEVAERYLTPKPRTSTVEFWSFSHPIHDMPPGRKLRIISAAPFMLRWTLNDWQSQQDTNSSMILTGVQSADISVPQDQHSPIRFAIQWTAEQKWEPQNFEVRIS